MKMVRFTVQAKVFEVLKDACFGVVAARGVDNRTPRPEIAAILQEATARAAHDFQGGKVKEHPSILPYREAFRTLGYNPNKYPCSIEALAQRVVKGGAPPSINNAVDLANAVSLQYHLPIGAHDMDRFSGDVELRFSEPGDIFIPFGGAENDPPEPGELVYASGNRVKTRRWIWRQGEDGKITPECRNLFFPIDGFRGINEAAVLKARDRLAALLEGLFQCQVKTGFVHRENPVMEL